LEIRKGKETLRELVEQSMNTNQKYVGFTLSQATKALRERRDIALLYF